MPDTSALPPFPLPPLNLTGEEHQLIRAARSWLDQPIQRTDNRAHTEKQLRDQVRLLQGDCETARLMLDLALPVDK
jgi:hypothetical protein